MNVNEHKKIIHLLFKISDRCRSSEEVDGEKKITEFIVWAQLQTNGEFPSKLTPLNSSIKTVLLPKCKAQWKIKQVVNELHKSGIISFCFYTRQLWVSFFYLFHF